MNDALKIFLPAVISFITGILLTPIATHYFYKYKMWRKVARINNITNKDTTFNNINDGKAEISTPRTGGMIVWISVIFTVAIVWIFDLILNNGQNSQLYFINRSQTILPFFTLILASIVGLGDDFLQIFGKGKWLKDPIFLRYLKVGIILLLGLIIGWWFYFKLGVNSLYIPWYGFIKLGVFFIPFFILIMLSLWSYSVIVGIEGLSGGVLASILLSYTIIDSFNNQEYIATFCAVITGSIIAFLWFNIPPARFYMGESGMIGLTVTLSVIAFMTDTVLLLPIIAFPLFLTSFSDVVQILSKKLFNGKKVFRLAPLHHHFEAIGWPKYKVTMRYWIVGIMSSIIGVIVSLIN